MKVLLLALIFLVLSISSFAQEKFIGQTRDYIIKTHSECYISENSDEQLHLLCDEKEWVFIFKKGSLLCEMAVIVIAKDSKPDFIATLEIAGYEEVDKNEEYNDGTFNIKFKEGIKYAPDGHTSILITKNKQ